MVNPMSIVNKCLGKPMAFPKIHRGSRIRTDMFSMNMLTQSGPAQFMTNQTSSAPTRGYAQDPSRINQEINRQREKQTPTPTPTPSIQQSRPMNSFKGGPIKTADTVIAGRDTLTKVYPDQTVVINRSTNKVMSITPNTNQTQKTSFMEKIFPKAKPAPNVSSQVSAGKNLLKEFYPELSNTGKPAKKPFNIFG